MRDFNCPDDCINKATITKFQLNGFTFSEQQKANGGITLSITREFCSFFMYNKAKKTFGVQA